MIKLFEKYTDIKDIKEEIFIKAIETSNINVVKFFIKKGYDIEGEKALFMASFYDNIFRYFLSKKPNFKNIHFDYSFKERMQDIEIQKAFIDFDYGDIIYNTVGFNNNLRNDPKYSSTVEMYEDVDKYNM